MEVESVTEPESATDPGMPRRPRVYEAGLFMVVVVVPLAFIPISTSPFADLKFVMLALGVLLLWASAPPIDRRLAVLAGCWFGASVLGAVFGVDPGRSITGTENSPGGIALVLLCAYLVSVGAAMPSSYQDRLPRWVASTAAAVAAIAIIWRISPEVFSIMPGLSLSGSTFGNAAFMPVYLSLGLIALPHLKIRLWQSIAGGVLFGLALGATPQRSALVFPVVGFLLSVWHSGVSRRQAGAVALSALVAFLLWGLLPAGAITSLPGASEADTGRAAALAAVVRAAGERPVLGWGPGNTLPAWLSGIRPGDPTAERYADAHNIFFEQLSATGFVGILAFMALAGVLAVRILRRPRPTGWLAGAVVVLVLYHLIQPLNLALTSLAFLVLGLSALSGDNLGRERRQGRRVARLGTGAALVSVMVVSVLTLTSAVIEQYERTYFTPDHEGLRLATTITPWRLRSNSDLVIQLALDGRSGDQVRAAEALALAGRMVEEHPDYPGVYLDVIQAHKLVLDPEGAVPVIEEFERRFPLLPHPTVDDLGPSGLLSGLDG